MYKQYFQLQEAPFSIAPNPRFLFMSSRHQEALAHLLYGIDIGGGFVALTGEVGTGKTTLCRRLLESLPEHVEIALILNPKLNVLELLASICDELGIDYPEAETSQKQLIDRLNKHLIASHSQGQRTVLIIDEAQNLSLEVLEQIRLLTNLETSEIKLLQIILIGQPELQQLLNDNALRQLNQRITARYHLLALTPTETRLYIEHRLSVSGGDPKLFNSAAIKKVYRRSKGIPRLINVICDRALLGAYAANKKIITPSIVNRAAKETLLPDAAKPKFLPLIILAACMLAFIAGAGFFYYNQPLFDRLDAGAQVDQSTNKQVAVEKVVEQLEPPAKETMPVIITQSIDQEVIPVIFKPAPVPLAAAIIPVVIKQPIEQDLKSDNLGQVISNQQLNLSNALKQVVKQWGIAAAEDGLVNCPYLNTLGLHCLIGTSTWPKISAFNRPVILELSMINGDIRHVLVVSAKDTQLAILIDGKTQFFSKTELLSTWQGHFLVVWQPALPSIKYLYPNSNSEQIIWLRTMLNQADGIVSTQSPFFDEQLKDRLVRFQLTNQLLPDGIAGPKTLIHLQNLSNTSGFPTLY